MAKPYADQPPYDPTDPIDVLSLMLYAGGAIGGAIGAVVAYWVLSDVLESSVLPKLREGRESNIAYGAAFFVMALFAAWIGAIGALDLLPAWPDAIAHWHTINMISATGGETNA